MAAIFASTIREFVSLDADQVLGILTSGLAREGFDTSVNTALSWEGEIADLVRAFRDLPGLIECAGNWAILLEYVIPIVGKRIDCVLLADSLIFVIEYKGGTAATSQAALRQAQDYAVSLADFHEGSRGRTIVPVAVGNFGSRAPRPDFARGLSVSHADLAANLRAAYLGLREIRPHIDHDAWNRSRYFPVPTIIEAACAIYQDHDVKDLAFSRAGIENLEATENAVAEAVADARARQVRKLVVLTGVPGAGKTLAGLNVIQRVSKVLDPALEQAAFLSGNSPLVAVLQEALKRSVGRSRMRTSNAVRSRVREIHRFIRETYQDTRPPSERLIVFDEAQRAWTAARNLKKFGRDISEPDMALKIMGRHEGWAVIVALVGGGQEIHAGEAGLAAWGDALSRHTDWELSASPVALDGGPALAGSRMFRKEVPAGLNVVRQAALHLAISKRSIETEVTTSWVNAMLNSDTAMASSLAGPRMPIWLTRDLNAARHWLRSNIIGSRRAGLVASSGAARLRAEGIEPPTFDFLRGIDYVRWFLEPQGDYRSSNQLEVALSEFEMQGLELDLVGLIWGGDLICRAGRLVSRRIRGKDWQDSAASTDPDASADDPGTRIRNKYRVLLTRFRKGMVIVVPRGSADDDTQSPEDFNATFEYLRECGLPLLDSKFTD